MDPIIWIWCIIVAFIIGIGVGGSAADSHWKKNTVRLGAAQYNPKTGKWEWLDRTDASATEGGE